MYFGITAVNEASNEKEISKVKSNVVRVYQHMIKYEYQPNKQTKSWLNSMFQGRQEIIKASKTDKKSNKMNINIIRAVKSSEDSMFDEAKEQAAGEMKVKTKNVSVKDKSIYNIDTILAPGFIEKFAYDNLNIYNSDISEDTIEEMHNKFPI